MIMVHAKAVVLAINDQYRNMYGLPLTIKAGSTLEEILQHRVENGLFTGDVTHYLAGIVERVTRRQPSSDEITLSDGRVISIQERAMDGGGWIAMHDDVTEQRRSRRILERTEQFLATIIENIPQGIAAKGARTLPYRFVNPARGRMNGLLLFARRGRPERELFTA